MELTPCRLRDILHYDPDMGVFTWRERSDAPANWNARWASKMAGTISVFGYRVISINGRIYRAGRLAWLYMTGEWPENDVDHIDGNRGNDKWVNLRCASRCENQRNRGTQSNNKCGLKGVSWHKHMERWRSTIRVSGKCIHLTYSDCPAAAYFAYIIAADKYFGDFARSA